MRRESRGWFSVKFYPIAQFSNFILKEFLKGLVGVKNLLSNACQRSAFVVPTDATGKLENILFLKQVPATSWVTSLFS